jgi:hypothetical protein
LMVFTCLNGLQRGQGPGHRQDYESASESDSENEITAFACPEVV